VTGRHVPFELRCSRSLTASNDASAAAVCDTHSGPARTIAESCELRAESGAGRGCQVAVYLAECAPVSRSVHSWSGFARLMWRRLRFRWAGRELVGIVAGGLLARVGSAEVLRAPALPRGITCRALGTLPAGLGENRDRWPRGPYCWLPVPGWGPSGGMLSD